MDPWGRHGLSCKNSKGTHPRHSHANDLIKRGLSSAGTPAMLEPPGLSRRDGKRPDGLTLFPWSGGKNLVWDFTCRDTLAPSHIAGTSREIAKAAKEAETAKSTLYNDLVSQYDMVPVAVETLGSWGPSGLKFIKDIGSRIAAVTGEKRSKFFLFQAISMAIQRGNVISVLGTTPDSKKLDEILQYFTVFYL